MGVAIETVTCARDRLLERYSHVISMNPDLDRSLVSFQANKREPFYRWFKYKEGFSSRLVEYFLAKVGRKPGVLLDPFAGTGAALFASRDLGWNAVGIELLPVGFYVMSARDAAESLEPADLAGEIKKLRDVSLLDYYDPDYAFSHLRITARAFSPATERQIAGWRAFCANEVADPNVRTVFEFACFSILEEISYTRKDGQYLRWDSRTPGRNLRGTFNKGKIPRFRETLLRKLRAIADDLADNGLFASDGNKRPAVDIRRGSCLSILPRSRARSVDFVLTSPPYCNRYDYTRTYALELAFLGYDDDCVKKLRQEMLSCTVENKEKVQELRQLYSSRRRLSDFQRIEQTFMNQEALQEVLAALETHRAAGRLNNPNVVRMVRNYFYEMCFVIFELARVLRPGGKIVLVNDNVRYAGEEVPVDLILSDFAQTYGLSVKHIWTLPRGKGNSSQQMGCHGRRELRKCVYVWQKEE